MKRINLILNTGLLAFLFPELVQAQNKIVIDKNSVSTWLEQNWILLAIGGLALVLFFAFGSKSSITKRTTTTVTKDEDDRVKSVTTVREE